MAEVAARGGSVSHPPRVSGTDQSGWKLFNIQRCLWMDDQVVCVGSPPHTGQAGPAVVAPDAKRSCLVHWARKGTSCKVWSAMQTVLFRGWKGICLD